jgi:hypothetical protein
MRRRKIILGKVEGARARHRLDASFERLTAAAAATTCTNAFTTEKKINIKK